LKIIFLFLHSRYSSDFIRFRVIVQEKTYIFLGVDYFGGIC